MMPLFKPGDQVITPRGYATVAQVHGHGKDALLVVRMHDAKENDPTAGVLFAVKYVKLDKMVEALRGDN